MKIKNFITTMISIFAMSSLFCCLNQKPYVKDKYINVEKIQNNENKGESTFNIKMIDLKCKFGDSTLITYKDKHVLIDAGGESNSSTAIYESIKNLNFIDYIIFTHADADHISNFVDKPTAPFERWFAQNPKNKIGTIIDFDMPEVRSIYNETNEFGQVVVKKNYVEYKKYKDKLKGIGKLNSYMNAKEAINGSNKGFFSLDSDITTNGFRILDNYFYDHLTTVSISAARNNVSVCTLFEIDNYKYLFTGDLEEYQSQNPAGEKVDDIGKPYKRIYGETMLAIMNYDYLKDGVVFFKAGHHGSDTSNSTFLLDLIRPRYIGVSCSVTLFNSSRKEKFPGQVALINMAKWTDYIYFNDRFDDREENIIPYYGDITLKYYPSPLIEINKFDFGASMFDIDPKLERSGTIDPILLSRKKLNMHIYNLGEEHDGFGIYSNISKLPTFEPKDTYEKCISKIKNSLTNNPEPLTGSIIQSNATFIKFGHIDILINLGCNEKMNPINNIDKVNKLCNDNKLEYLILSNNDETCYNNLVGERGLLKNTSINKIDNFFYFGKESILNSSENLKKINSILEDKLIKSANVLTSAELNGTSISILKNKERFDLSFKFLKMPYTNNKINTDFLNEPSYHNLMFTVEINNRLKDKDQTMLKFTYANIGDIHDPILLQKILDNNNIASVNLFDFMSKGYINQSDADSLKVFSNANKAFGNPYLLYNGMLYRRPIIKQIYSLTKIIPTSIVKTSANGSSMNYVTGNTINRILFGPDDGKAYVRHLILGSNDINYASDNLTSTVKLKYDRNTDDKFGESLLRRYD